MAGSNPVRTTSATGLARSGQIALAGGLFHQFLQFRHRLFDSSMMRLFVPDGSDPLDVARAHADIGDVRPLRFQELVDVILKRSGLAWWRPRKTALPALLNSDGPEVLLFAAEDAASKPDLDQSVEFRGNDLTPRAFRALHTYCRRGLLSMKLFRCQVCDNIIYFENRTCGRCGHRLGYVPELEIMAALEPAGGESWTPLAGESGPRRFCANADYDVCNWLTTDEGRPGSAWRAATTIRFPTFLKPRISRRGETSSSPSTGCSTACFAGSCR